MSVHWSFLITTLLPIGIGTTRLLRRLITQGSQASDKHDDNRKGGDLSGKPAIDFMVSGIILTLERASRDIRKLYGLRREDFIYQALDFNAKGLSQNKIPNIRNF